MDTGTGQAVTPQEPAAQQPARAKKLSAGAKWGIGIGIGFALLTLASCGLMAWALSSSDGMSFSSGQGVALIRIDGVIAGTGTVYDGYISPEYFLDQLDQALADPNVAAILLRIDSPGGTVAASQEISLAVKRASEQKPVVANIGDIGASGAYMVAAQCDHIVASPGSAVGSIGVIMRIPNVAGLMDKLGVEFTTITSGDLKDAGSPYRSITATETALLEGQIDVAYEQFVADVAEGRGMSEAKVRELATGWVWLAAEAVELGLVDELGNYDDAVAAAAKLGGIEGDPAIITYETADPFSDILSSLLGFRSSWRTPDGDTLRRFGLPR